MSEQSAVRNTAATWAVHRQDDNGCRFVVAAGLELAEAERLVAEFEAKGHKQTYWVRRDEPSATPIPSTR